MRHRKLVGALLALSLILAGCASSDDDDASGTGAGTDADASEADASGEADGGEAADAADETEELIRSAGDGVPDPDFDYAGLDYNVPVQQSALRGDRLHPSFPPPVVEPTLIRSGGQPPDGIFPIDKPTFAPFAEIDYDIADNEAVIAVDVDGDARAFPVQLMIWHEIVNTEIGGVPVTVTYCPLCNSALSFDRRFEDYLLDFGTSGELYQSALVMYDRQTDTLWSHFTGTGLVGHLAGAELTIIPTQTVSYGDWKAANPDGQVLTRDLSAPPQYQNLYGSNPYAGYDFEGLDPFGQFFVGEIDRTLLAKARIVGIADDDTPKAVRFDDLANTPVIPVTVGGEDAVVLFKPGLASALDDPSIAEGRDVGQSGVFRPVAADGTALTFTADGDGFVDGETGSMWNVLGQATDGPRVGERLQSVAHIDTFWFAWAAYQPGTEIIRPDGA
ncbi:MAG: DUF3179 domain-containing protein [Actinomycetota bacterium]